MKPGSVAMYPGSFDPITYGHLDIIKRASKMFGQLIVLVADNSQKQCSFTPEERVDMIRKCIPDLPAVTVEHYGGLLAEYAALHNISVIVKGLRAMSDFEYEFQMALTNKKLNPNVETVYLTTASENMYLSSSMVKQIARMGGNISDFVPDAIRQDIINRIFIKNNAL